jgi:hypothetical protein
MTGSLSMPVHPDLTIANHTYMKEVEFLMSLVQCDEDQVIHEIDCIQSSDQEKKVLHKLVCSHLNAKDTGEWMDVTNDHLFGEHKEDTDKIFTDLLDEAEMDGDMSAFEDCETCHELFAENPWESRSMDATAMNVNKKSQFNAWGAVTHVGEAYATAETDYGKVFIPNHSSHLSMIEVGEDCYMRLSFKGFEDARQTAMPWRCVQIHKTSGVHQ